MKETRIKRKLSLAKLEQITKIKKNFIEALEKENWQSLPEYPVLTGFVKSLSRALRAEEKSMIALLRRDYPPRVLPINPKPDIENKFIWSPKLTFLAGVGIALVLILGYLGLQYKKFISPPSLFVYEPKDEQIVDRPEVKVRGKTDSDAVVKVNNQPVIVDDLGNFSTEIEINKETKRIEIKAISRSGRETIIHRKIIPKLEF